jgi:branched-chain amino acid transport system permease protein
MRTGNASSLPAPEPATIESAPGLSARTRWGAGLGVVVVACVLPFVVPSYVVYQLTLALAYALACLGLNVLTGYTGLVSLGQGFFFAAGAYVTAWLVTRYDVNLLAALPVTIVLTSLLGLVLALPVVRLSGFSLGLVTLGIGFACTPLARRVVPITGGNSGTQLPALAPPGLPSVPMGTFLYLCAVVVLAIVVVLVTGMVQRRVGRAMTAVRDDEEAARAMGIHANWVKAQAFAISAGLAGAGGWVYALTVGYVAPTSFPFILSVYLVAGIVVGGTASIVGSIIGGFIVEFVPPLAGDINQGATDVVLGVVLILVMAFVPGGLVGSARQLLNRRRPPRGEPTAGTPAPVPDAVPETARLSDRTSDLH